MQMGGEQEENTARGDHGDRPEPQRDQRRHRRAEDRQQHQQEERDRDQLGPLGGGDRLVLDRPRERGIAGLVGLDRSVDLGSEDLIQPRNDVGDRFRGAGVEVSQDQRLVRAGAQARERIPVPGREGGDLGVGAQSPDQRRALAVERGGGAAQEDRERRRFAEVRLQQISAPGRGGAGDPQRGRGEPAFEARADDSEGDDRDYGRRQGEARMAKGERRAPLSGRQGACSADPCLFPFDFFREDLHWARSAGEELAGLPF